MYECRDSEENVMNGCLWYGIVTVWTGENNSDKELEW